MLVRKAAPRRLGRTGGRKPAASRVPAEEVRAWVMPVLQLCIANGIKMNMDLCRITSERKQKQLGCSLVDITILLIYFGITQELRGL